MHAQKIVREKEFFATEGDSFNAKSYLLLYSSLKLARIHHISRLDSTTIPHRGFVKVQTKV